MANVVAQSAQIYLRQTQIMGPCVMVVISIQFHARHRAQAFLGQQQVSIAAKQRVELLSGSRFTSLMHLEYFDCIRFHIIDAMHNLFLRTAKHVMKNMVK